MSRPAAPHKLREHCEGVDVVHGPAWRRRIHEGYPLRRRDEVAKLCQHCRRALRVRRLHCACPRGRAECGDVVCVLLRRAAMLPLIRRGVAEWACEPKQAR
eukprot:5411963-Pleurochrysis_carterae.AAC.1